MMERPRHQHLHNEWQEPLEEPCSWSRSVSLEARQRRRNAASHKLLLLLARAGQ